MHGALSAYFDDEKNAGLMLAGIGLALLAGAGALFPARLGLRPFAITLAVFAALKLAIGIGLYVKTGPQVAALVEQLGRDANALFASETLRMLVVQRNFVWIESAWAVVIVASVAVASWKKEHPIASGIALGLLVGASLLLPFDRIAERRGKVYLDALRAASQESTGVARE
jgi:hypothetical protein